MMHKDLVVLILASGAGRRFGGPKQLALIDGESMLVRAINTCLQLTETVIVVTGAHREAVESAIDHKPIQTVYNADWEEGMGSSIRAGVHFIRNTLSKPNKLLVTLADTPHIEPRDYGRLLSVSADHPDSCVAAEYSKTRGVPAIFPDTFWGMLSKLEGDRGARDILRQHESVVGVPMANASRDIDTPDDLN